IGPVVRRQRAVEAAHSDPRPAAAIAEQVPPAIDPPPGVLAVPPDRDRPGAKRDDRPGGSGEGPEVGGDGVDRSSHRCVDGPGQTADGASTVTNEGGEPRRAD